MTVKELIEQLKKFDGDLPVCYVNEDSGYNDEVEEIQENKTIIVLAREGCFG